MSQWFDQSNNANKLRQSYVKGFLDVSGGGVYIRSDNSLNLYTTDEGAIPAFGMDAVNYRVKGKGHETDPSGAEYTDVSMNKLAYLHDLSDNVQDQLDPLIEKTKYIYSDGSDNQTVLQLNGSDPENKELVVWGNIVPGEAEAYNIGSAEKPFDSIFLKNNTIYFDTVTGGDTDPAGAMSFNADTGLLDISYNGTFGTTVLSYNNKVGLNIADHTSPTAELDLSGTLKVNGQVIVETGDISLNDNLFVGGDASLNSKLTVQGAAMLDSTLDVSDNATFNSILTVHGDTILNSQLDVLGATSLISTLSVGQDASLNANLYVIGDVSLNSKLYVKDATMLDSTLNVIDATILGSTLEVQHDASLNTNLRVGGDASFNKNLYVDGETVLNADVSLNSNLDIGGNLVIKGNLSVFQTRETETIYTKINNYEIIISQDLSLNGELFVSGDASLNAGLMVMGDASFNGKLSVAGDVSLNSTLQVGENFNQYTGFLVQY